MNIKEESNVFLWIVTESLKFFFLVLLPICLLITIYRCYLTADIGSFNGSTLDTFLTNNIESPSKFVPKLPKHFPQIESSLSEKKPTTTVKISKDGPFLAKLLPIRGSGKAFSKSNDASLSNNQWIPMDNMDNQIDIVDNNGFQPKALHQIRSVRTIRALKGGNQKMHRRVKRAKDDAEKSDDDAKKSDDDAEKSEDDAKKSDDDAEKSEEDAKKSDDDTKKSDDDGKKSDGDGKRSGGDGKKSDDDAKESDDDSKGSDDDAKGSGGDAVFKVGAYEHNMLDNIEDTKYYHFYEAKINPDGELKDSNEGEK